MTLNSHTLSTETLNSVYNSHVTRCLCFRLFTEGFCSPTPKFMKCFHNLWPSFLPKRQFSNEKIWCLETKLWLKVIFSQCVQGYAETYVWFVHVTDFYYPGKKNLNKFFSNYKISFCSKLAHIDLYIKLPIEVWQALAANGYQ